MCTRMKQYLSDTDYLEKIILHMPVNLIRDAADIVPVGNPATSQVFGWEQVYSLVGMFASPFAHVFDFFSVCKKLARESFLAQGLRFLLWLQRKTNTRHLSFSIQWPFLLPVGMLFLLQPYWVANPDRARRDSDQAADPEKLLKFAQKMRSLLWKSWCFIPQQVEIQILAVHWVGDYKMETWKVWL